MYLQVQRPVRGIRPPRWRSPPGRGSQRNSGTTSVTKTACADQRESESQTATLVREPSAWISALLVVTKANGDIRICIDPKPLNKELLRDHYPMPTIDDVLPQLANAKDFTTVDTRNTFWHLALDEESSKLSTFETPFDKFRWLRLRSTLQRETRTRTVPETHERSALRTVRGRVYSRRRISIRMWLYRR